jgi:hypothetical protein
MIVWNKYTAQSLSLPSFILLPPRPPLPATKCF